MMKWKRSRKALTPQNFLRNVKKHKEKPQLPAPPEIRMRFDLPHPRPHDLRKALPSVSVSSALSHKLHTGMPSESSLEASINVLDDDYEHILENSDSGKLV